MIIHESKNIIMIIIVQYMQNINAQDAHDEHHVQKFIFCSKI